MKILRIVALVIFSLYMTGCKQNIKKAEEPTIEPIKEQQQVVVVPKKINFSTALLTKRKADGTLLKKTPQEIVKTVEARLLTAGYLPLAKHLLFDNSYTIKDKIFVFKELKKLSNEDYINDVLSFFEIVLAENEAYLTENPLKDIENSLVSRSPDSSEFLKDHPEISSVIWSLEELFGQGNTLLQEAVRLHNRNAVHYLLQQGATPRYLKDPRGPVLALEWADKYGYTDIAQLLSKDINTSLQDTKTTLLDELLYQDPDAARLVRKYGGKTAVELT